MAQTTRYLPLVFLLLGIKSYAESASWDYMAQSAWGGVANGAICTSGSKQSPIDVKADEVEAMNEGPLTWKNNATKLGTVTVSNNGHGFSVSSDAMAQLILSGGGLVDKYQLAQFHYHWGSSENEYKGSEHRVDGKQWASELHLVHFNNKYDNLAHALNAGGKTALAVVGVMLKKGTGAAAGHETVLSEALSVAKYYGNSTTVDMGAASILNFLPSDVKSFFRYEGSLTTPTCNEQVVWTLLKEEVTIAKSLLDVFATVEDSHNAALNYTARDAQALNSRKVRYNTFSDSTGSKTPPRQQDEVFYNSATILGRSSLLAPLFMNFVAFLVSTVRRQL